VIFFHHGDTEDSETIILFAHRKTRSLRLSESDGGQAAMGKKPEPSVKPSSFNGTLNFLYAPASMLFVCLWLIFESF
jgi:hypothetical protein